MGESSLSWKAPRVAVIIGMAAREGFSFWTGHPFDFEVWVRNAVYVSRGLSPYSYMDPVSGLSFAFLGQRLPSVGYLPLWSLVLAGLYQFFTILPATNRFFLYFLIKQPSIVGDVLLGYMLYRAVVRWGGTEADGRRILSFWMLFPYPILISAIWGQFDSLVAVLWIASLVVTKTTKKSVLEGLSILLKIFPLIFVPYHVLRDRGVQKVRQVVTVGIPVAATAIAFQLGGWGYESFQGTMVSGARGVPLGMTILGVIFSPGTFGTLPGMEAAFGIVAWIWVPAVIFGGYLAFKRFSSEGKSSLVQSLLLVTTVFFLFRAQVYEQYLLYLLPLLLLDVFLWHPKRIMLFHMTWIIGLVYLLFNNDFLIRFIVPILPAAEEISYSLDNNSPFGTLRAIVLPAISLVFAVHLVQLALVLIDEERSTQPWLIRLLRRIALMWKGHLPPEEQHAEGPKR